MRLTGSRRTFTWREFRLLPSSVGIGVRAEPGSCRTNFGVYNCLSLCGQLFGRNPSLILAVSLNGWRNGPGKQRRQRREHEQRAETELEAAPHGFILPQQHGTAVEYRGWTSAVREPIGRLLLS